VPHATIGCVRVTVLTYLESETDRGDPVARQVADALRSAGHHVSILGVYDDLQKLLRGIEQRRPDLIFNLMEMFGENLLGDVSVAGLLELIGVPFTGGSARELALSQDKALAKKVLAFDGVPSPRFAVFRRGGSFEGAGSLRMPLFVKPLRCDASLGVDAHSLVHDAGSLMKRVLAIHDQVNDAALVEEFIEGRELYVGIIGNESPEVFPVVEMDFSGLPAGAPRVLDYRAKFALGTPEYQGTHAVMATLSDELRARVQRIALDAYRALKVRDYGRVDLRLTEGGELHVIEVNANCYLERSGEFVMAAAAAGLDYAELVNRLARLALERHGSARWPVAVEELTADSGRDERDSSQAP
jgi:D-alanine-D-alanine ligase